MSSYDDSEARKRIERLPRRWFTSTTRTPAVLGLATIVVAVIASRTHSADGLVVMYLILLGLFLVAYSQKTG